MNQPIACIVLVLAAACGTPAAPRPPRPVPEAVVLQQPRAAVEVARPARVDLAVGESPMSVVVAGRRLVWTDSTGAIWAMPSDGSGSPKQLSDQKTVGFAFHPVVVDGEAFVSTKRDVLRVALPDGPVTKVGVRGLAEDPEEVVADERFIYVTLFKRDEVMAIDPRAGSARQLMKFRRGVLAIHGATLYAVSYSTGVLVAVPTAGGAPKKLARGFVQPTGLAVDDTHAFVYTERDQTLRKVELATGAITMLADHLNNSDNLVSDGSWIYTFSWPAKLVRIAKQGGAVQVIAADLASPYDLVIDREAVYVTSRDQHKIVRFDKRAMDVK